MLFRKKCCIFAPEMKTADLFYRLGAFLKHQLTSWNTGGEGIHSPYLFYLVRMLFYDQNAYYVFRDIEYRRTCMMRAPKRVPLNDYGTGQATEALVSDIAKTSLESPKIGQLLFRLVSYMGHDEKRPLQVMELGTSLGITTAYLAAPDSRNQVVTFEGSPALIEMAQLNWKHLGLTNIDVVEGNIDETLPKWLKAQKSREVDVVFMDANHTKEATLRYFDLLIPYTSGKTIVVIDDIHYSREMQEAWEQIKQREEVTTTMDLYDCGLVFFDPHYLKRHYKLRI